MRALLLTVVFLSNISLAETSAQKTISGITEAVHSFTDKAPSESVIESAFSPDAGSEALVLKVIHTSRINIKLAAYSFTSPIIVKALLDAKRRGVNVMVVLDDKGNRSKASTAALNLLVGADIPVRTISKYAIHHDKYIVSDEKHVQTGSFNYSLAAAKSNSENVLVIWNNSEIAMSYITHWKNRFNQGTDVKLTF
jgi:phosphatidylserine/phosphatidylglycerophosphate/cardiolipin synthase-like enzyme